MNGERNSLDERRAFKWFSWMIWFRHPVEYAPLILLPLTCAQGRIWLPENDSMRVFAFVGIFFPGSDSLYFNEFRCGGWWRFNFIFAIDPMERTDEEKNFLSNLSRRLSIWRECRKFNSVNQWTQFRNHSWSGAIAIGTTSFHWLHTVQNWKSKWQISKVNILQLAPSIRRRAFVSFPFALPLSLLLSLSPRYYYFSMRGCQFIAQLDRLSYSFR